ncbi:MAG: hypothetical protein ABIR66_12775 [Saprospiraceae bacterium]
MRDIYRIRQITNVAVILPFTSQNENKWYTKEKDEEIDINLSWQRHRVKENSKCNDNSPNYFQINITYFYLSYHDVNSI